MIHIFGAEENIAKAKALLETSVANAPNASLLGSNCVSKVIPCPPHLVGLIIGFQVRVAKIQAVNKSSLAPRYSLLANEINTASMLQGSSLKKLTATTSCQISINQCVKGKEPRKIILSGRRECVDFAEKLILEKLETPSHCTSYLTRPGLLHTRPPPIQTQHTTYYDQLSTSVYGGMASPSSSPSYAHLQHHQHWQPGQTQMQGGSYEGSYMPYDSNYYYPYYASANTTYYFPQQQQLQQQHKQTAAWGQLTEAQSTGEQPPDLNTDVEFSPITRPESRKGRRDEGLEEVGGGEEGEGGGGV